MNSFPIKIGTDTSICMACEGAPASNAVWIDSYCGNVTISGPFDGWAGYQVLAIFDDETEADSLANRIGASPVAELEALGYDYSGWFEATTCPLLSERIA